MGQDQILIIVREALLLVLLVSAPVVAVSLFVGLVISLLQATTQLQDHTLSFVPKLIAVMLALMIAGPWMGAHLLRFTRSLLQAIAWTR